MESYLSLWRVLVFYFKSPRDISASNENFYCSLCHMGLPSLPAIEPAWPSYLVLYVNSGTLQISWNPGKVSLFSWSRSSSFCLSGTWHCCFHLILHHCISKSCCAIRSDFGLCGRASTKDSVQLIMAQTQIPPCTRPTLIVPNILVLNLNSLDFSQHCLLFQVKPFSVIWLDTGVIDKNAFWSLHAIPVHTSTLLMEIGAVEDNTVASFVWSKSKSTVYR